MAKAQEPRPFGEIARSFIANLRALRVLNGQIGTQADEHDKAIAEKFSNGFLQLFGLPKMISPPGEDHGTEPTAELSPEAKKSVEQAVERLISDPDAMHALAQLSHEAQHSLPIHGSLLRRGALTTLVSFFETLLSDLIQAYYLRYPSGLPQDAHSLTLAEIKALGSFEEAEKYILEKESESVLRQTLDDQFKYFTSRLKVDMTVLEPYRADAVEVTQRRNVVVHNNAIVNRIYLAKAPKGFIEEHKIVEGDELKTSQEYLERAIAGVFVLGLVLLQQCWRKWDKDDASQADDLLIDQSYALLLEGRQEELVKLSPYAQKLTFETDHHSRVIRINVAIALKKLGRVAEMESVLSAVDWSATSLKFQAALFALRGDFERLAAIIPSAVAAGEISLENLKVWPLFDEARKTAEFSSAIAKVGGGKSTAASADS